MQIKEGQKMETNLRSKFQTRQRLTQMGLQRADHDKHKGLGVAAERELEKVGQLNCTSISKYISRSRHGWTGDRGVFGEDLHTLLFR